MAASGHLHTGTPVPPSCDGLELPADLHPVQALTRMSCPGTSPPASHTLVAQGQSGRNPTAAGTLLLRPRAKVCFINGGGGAQSSFVSVWQCVYYSVTWPHAQAGIHAGAATCGMWPGNSRNNNAASPTPRPTWPVTAVPDGIWHTRFTAGQVRRPLSPPCFALRRAPNQSKDAASTSKDNEPYIELQPRTSLACSD